MGRPEPCILFAQSFVHSQLDEYVDEVIFTEPVVITACEFLEQNASPPLPNVPLIGATSPPSFALEIFVHCEGESRFRRLCQPFLYSHSSSNVLEVEAVVTNHLVLRGSYRGLTLVIYGNTAEDLGQFNIELDLDSSLANVVYSPSEGKLEDLPPALRSAKLTFEDSISSLRSLNFPFPELDNTAEVKLLLLLIFKTHQISNEENTVCKVVNSVVSALSSHVLSYNSTIPAYWDNYMLSLSDNKKDPQQLNHVLAEARNELFEIYKIQVARESSQSLENEIVLGSETEAPTSELLVDMFNKSFPFLCRASDVKLSLISQNKEMIIGLGIALLLCSSREGCYHFINRCGMEKIINIFSDDVKKSTSITLMLLGVIEFSTRHSIGCEGFLGWWPREDENVPIGKSDGYCSLLKLLLVKQRHDVASLACYVMHRLRFYEIASRYESAVLSVLSNLSADSRLPPDGTESLETANILLKQISKLLTSFGPIEDPSPMASACKLSIPGQSEGILSYRTTINIFATSNCNFAKWDIDTYLLSLLMEKGFFPLSTALLSSPIPRSENGNTVDIFVEIMRSIESILLSLLFCRSGLSYLLAQPEATALMILCLQDVEDMSKKECMTLRQAAIFLSKGFFCRPQEVGMITELHLRVGAAVDRLLTTPQSDELLWVLWDLCAISRSDSGRQALLALGYFPEALSVLMNGLCSFKDVESVAIHNGTSSLGLAIFHSAAEIFEVMVTDSTASSLRSWLGHSVELHKALHSISPGSSRKDAPTRLLEWIDAGVVYHRNGAIGLLRYTAILASGGDAHLSSTNVLVSDSVDVENVVGDSTNGLDAHVVDNLLGKFVLDKYFDGFTLGNTSIVQLTTSFRILAVLSENSAVAATLFEEGAVTVVYVILVNCKCMLERLSNSYDYLVDEGAECNSTSDLLLERSHEQRLLDLMIPLLVLLINLLRKLQEAKEQYRNKKLLNALLKLHREVSPKLAACAQDMSFPYPSSALSFGAICHLLASALACWPVFGWIPGLFHCVLESVQATSLLSLGPKDACSILCLLGDLFPEEGIWLWKNKMPPLSALRALSIETISGAQAESDINWYLQPEHVAVLLVRLTPQLDRIAQIVLHFAFTSLVVIQDMLRILVIRIACQRIECAVVLLRPVISWMDSHINETSLLETDILKVHRLLQFIASLLEHPNGKRLLLKVGAVKILLKALKRCSDIAHSDGTVTTESRFPSKSITLLCWSLPLFKSLTYIFDLQTYADYSVVYDKHLNENFSIEDCTAVGHHLLKLCQVLPVGRELLACFLAFKELISCSLGKNAILSIYSYTRSTALEDQEADDRDINGNASNSFNWRWSPPFLNCWKKLLKSVDSQDTASSFVIETIYSLALSAIFLSTVGRNSEGIAILKALFGLEDDGAVVSSDEKLKDLHELIEKLEKRICEEESLTSSNRKTNLHLVKDSVKSMLGLLQGLTVSSNMLEGFVLTAGYHTHSDIVHSVIITSQLMSPRTIISRDDEMESSFSHVWGSNRDAEETSTDFTFRVLEEKFLWECTDTSLDRQMMPTLTGKRRMAPADGSGRRIRDNMGSDATGPNTFSRVLSVPSLSSGSGRRDMFRQRKPNTSRPPSMHVDDYVARERNVDGVTSGSNIVNSHHRVGSTSGRPPSIHVDEFMARQRERQNAISVTVGDASQLRNSVHDDGNDPAKLDRSQQLKADLDDDLQEIKFFDEESESDDIGPFPEPDENQPTLAVIRESSPGSIVEETEGDMTENTRVSRLSTPQASEDGSSRSDIPLRQSTSRSDIPVNQEVNLSAEKKLSISSTGQKIFREQSDESKYASPFVGSRGFDSRPQKNPTSFPSNIFNVFSASSVQPLPPPNFYRNSPQKAGDSSVVRSQGYSEQKVHVNQPPLPPMPPPALSASPHQSAEVGQCHSSAYLNNVRDVQPPVPSGYPQQAFDFNSTNTIAGFHIQSEKLFSSGNSPVVSMTAAHSELGSKYLWNQTPSSNRLHVDASTTSARPLPPLPPLPPPFSMQIMQSSATDSGSQASPYNQSTNVGTQLPPPSTPLNDTSLGIYSTSGASLASFSLPPFAQPSLFSRPFIGSPAHQLSQGVSNLSQNVPGPQPSIQSMQPLPPPLPQVPPPPHVQHSGPPLQISQRQPEQMISQRQNTLQVQVQPIQMPQQFHIPQLQFFYQPQQQEALLQPQQTLNEQVQPQILHPQADNSNQQQNDLGMSLQQYFASPEAIQSLLSDREKLCQLLEQNPKLMQMLQERLGQQ